MKCGDRLRLARYIDEPDERGCQRWLGQINPNGYGYSSLEGRSTTAHRIVYTVFVGPIPEGLQIDHLCRNRACVNTEHLEPVTAKENTRRAHGLSMTHCRQGHELATQTTPSGSCRACNAERARQERANRPRPPQVWIEFPVTNPPKPWRRPVATT